MFRIKNLFEPILILTLLATPFALQAREMVSVNRAVVNMRSAASTHHSVTWTLSRGYPLEVTGHKGKWLRVRDFENDTGWVYRPMVTKTPHMIVKSPVANIRSAPTTRSRIIGKAEYGQVLRTLEHRPDWVRIQRKNGLKGWISSRLIWGW